mgnify:CR=1 FL=1
MHADARKGRKSSNQTIMTCIRHQHQTRNKKRHKIQTKGKKNRGVQRNICLIGHNK